MPTKTLTFSPERGLISPIKFLQKIASCDIPTVTTNKKIVYFNVPCAFDIEVSSFYACEEKRATMYIWQFGILNWVTYGRTWEEYFVFLNALRSIIGIDSTHRLAIYVHNLAYEFQFLRKRIDWDKVFLLEERKPVYAITDGLEYRCSLKLSSKSLKKVGEDLIKYQEYKHTGDLDYQLVRHSKTPLTKEELGYCEADIRVLLAYIQEKIEIDGDITRIPMTNTGYVRNLCRKACFSRYKRYKNLMASLTLGADEYEQLKRGFSGGFTHACAKYVAEGNSSPLENVGSFDLTSSYPTVMIVEKFPMSSSRIIDNMGEGCDVTKWNRLHYYLNKYCCLFDVTLRGLVPKVDYDHPISKSKLIAGDGLYEDNGRIVYADSLTITCTEQDFFTYEKFYDWESYQIHLFRVYDKGYLPTELVLSIIELYKKKTILKDVEGEEVNYMISKNMLNAAYGMIVTDIVRDILDYDVDYIPKHKPEINDAIEQYNKQVKRFLFYPWGVWVTAYARRNLFSGILACGDDYIYSDTDSIKIFNPEAHMDYIDAYNSNMMKKVEKAAEHFGVEPAELTPLNRKGQPKPLGIWEFEGKYKRFKTLGAKRYLFERYEKDVNIEKGKYRYVLTVAGVNKKSACDYLVERYGDPFKGFTNHMKIPSDYSGRLTLTYFDEKASGVVTDYLGNTCEYEELSYIHMEPSEYDMSMSDTFVYFIRTVYGIKEDSW